MTDFWFPREDNGMNWKTVQFGEVFYNEQGKICGRINEGIGSSSTTAYISFEYSSKEKNIGEYISKHFAKAAVEEAWADFSRLMDELETAPVGRINTISYQLDRYRA